MSLRDFGPNELMFLLLATRWTILLALIAFAGGGLIGLIVAAIRVAPARPLRWLAAGYIQFFMGTPILIQLFMAYYGSSFLGYRPDPWVAAAVTFSLNGGAFFGEIFRGAIEAIPKGQWEAATALGFRFVRTLRLVIIPQAVTIALPGIVNVCIVVVKETVVVLLVGLFDFLAILQNGVIDPAWLVGDQIRATAYLFAGLVFWAICFSISRYSIYLERRLGTGRHH